MKYAILISVGLILASCGSGGSDQNLPITPFPERGTYTLSDFSLSKTVDYWHIEQGSMVDPYPDEVLFQFNADTYDGLSDTLKADIDSQNSNTGFMYGCDPSSCSHYGVTLEGSVIDLVISKDELLDLFQEVDTAAELDFWLWAHRYDAKLFELTETGYRVLSDTHPCNGNGELLLEVNSNGTIEVIRTVTPNTSNAVC